MGVLHRDDDFSHTIFGREIAIRLGDISRIVDGKR